MKFVKMLYSAWIKLCKTEKLVFHCNRWTVKRIIRVKVHGKLSEFYRNGGAANGYRCRRHGEGCTDGRGDLKNLGKTSNVSKN